MKIVSFCLCMLCVCTSLLAGSAPNYLTANDVMQGFKSHSITSQSDYSRGERQRWLGELYGKRTMLTNEVERIQLAKELVQILDSEKSSNLDKCAAAYLIGLFRLKDGIKALVSNFMLGNKEALDPDSIKLAIREMPARDALIEIGEPTTQKIIEFIESNTNSYPLTLASSVILYIEGQEDGATLLKQAVADQPDSKKKENLKAALASEYFTNPKYRASGPQKKQSVSEPIP